MALFTNTDLNDKAHPLKLTPCDLYRIYNGDIIYYPSEYLTQKNKELRPLYEKRAKNAYWYGHCKRVVDIYLGYVFTPKPKADENERDWDIEQLARDAFLHSSIARWAYIVIFESGPEAWDRRSVDIEKDNVYLYKVEDEFGTYSKHLRYTIDRKKEEIKEEKTGKISPFKEDQIMKVFWNSEKKSLIENISHVELSIYNKNTLKDFLEEKSTVYNTTHPKGITRLEPYKAYGVEKEDPGIKHSFPDVSGKIEQLEASIDRKTEYLAASVGLATEFARGGQLKIVTGEARKVDMQDTQSIILGAAFWITMACNQAAEIHKREYGGELAWIRIEPDIRQTTDMDRLNMLKETIEYYQEIPEVAIIFQAEMFRVIFPGLNKDIKDSALEAIKKGGGKLPSQSFTI